MRILIISITLENEIPIVNIILKIRCTRCELFRLFTQMLRAVRRESRGRGSVFHTTSATRLASDFIVRSPELGLIVWVPREGDALVHEMSGLTRCLRNPRLDGNLNLSVPNSALSPLSSSTCV